MADDKEILFQIAKSIGALDSNVSKLDEKIDRFKDEYEEGKRKAQSHAVFVEQTLDMKVDKAEIETLLSLNTVIKHWRMLAVVLAFLVALGFLAVGDKLKTMMETKKTIEKVIK